MALFKIEKTKYFNKSLLLSVLLIAVSTFNYGFDNQAFSSTQAMEPFQEQFGEWDEAAGRYNLDSDWLALFNSLNYAGFAAGMFLIIVKQTTGLPTVIWMLTSEYRCADRGLGL